VVIGSFSPFLGKGVCETSVDAGRALVDVVGFTGVAHSSMQGRKPRQI
jgi:hypothetical protein